MDTVKKLHQNNNPFLLRKYNGRIKTCRGCKMAFKTPVAPKFVIAHRERYVYGRTKRSKRLLMTERDFFYHCDLDCIQPRHPSIGDSRVVASRTSKQEGPGSIPGGGKEV